LKRGFILFMIQLEKLATECKNPASESIDQVSTLSMLQIINNEDKKIAPAIEAILPQIAIAVDTITAHLTKGGRLFYIGAGTSGRLGILDAAECPPTYGTDPELVQGLIAGGYAAIFNAQEGAEDSASLAVDDLKEKALVASDVVVGIAASGRTPYVLGGLTYAHEIGAVTISIACTPNAPITALADIALTPDIGPEVITGSTRMKAGTAQKLILNMLSTGTMIHLGKVYGNLMVDVKTSNKKLEERARRIVMEATGCDRSTSIQKLKEAHGQAKIAIFMLLSGTSVGKAEKLLDEAHGFVAIALKNLTE
jgi:N-acetylmuramic acid 6-phosphate etherase